MGTEAVELLFKFNTQGAPALDEVSKIVEQLGQKSALTGGQINIVEQALNTLVKSGETARSALELVAGSSATLGREAANAAKSLLEEATAVRSVGTAAESTIPPVLAASAALRGLEGSLNIRAAERFLTQFQGINEILGKTFQIFGALALAEFAVRGVEELHKLYDAMNPLIEAEKKYQQVAKDSGKAIQELRAEELKLYLDRVAHSQGAVAGLQAKINTPTDRVKVDAANFLDAINKVAEAEKALKDVQDFDAKYRAGALGGVASPAARAAQKGLDAAKITLEEAEHRVQVDREQKSATSAELSEKVQQRALDVAKARRDVEKQTLAYVEQALALVDKAELTGPLGSIIARSRDIPRQAAQQRSNLQDQIQRDRSGGPNSSHVPQSDYDAQLVAINDLEAKKQEALLAEAAAEVQKVSDALGKALAKINEEKSVLETDLLKSLAESNKYTVKKFDELVKYSGEIQKVDRAIDEITLNQQLKRTQRLTELGAPVGSTQGAVDVETRAYEARLAIINQIYERDQQDIAAITDVNKQTLAQKQAELKLTTEIGDARLDYEAKLAEIDRKHLQDARNEAGRVFDALVGGPKGIENLTRSFALSQGKAIFQNVTQDLFSSTSASLHGLVSQGSPLASLLRGTILEPSGTGTPIDKNTYSLDRTRDSLDRLTLTLARVGGLGGAGVTGPLAGSPLAGLSSILRKYGSDPNGLTGQGPLYVQGIGAFDSYNPTVGDNSDVPNYAAEAQAANLSAGGSKIGRDIGYAGAVIGAGYGVYSGIQEGGARGATTAIGSVLGAAAAFDPEPISKAVLIGAALVSGMIHSLLGDPKAEFDAKQTKTLNNDKYTGPRQINGLFDVATGSNAYNTSPWAGTRVITQNTFHINAVDAQSVSQLFENNGQQIAKVVGDLTRAGDPNMQIAINRVVFGPGAA